MKIAYTYTILRYVHDVASGEFANVGVVIFSSDARFAGAICRKTHGRISNMFPDMNRDGFKSLMRYIETQINAFGERIKDELPLEKLPLDAAVLARSVLPHDDSSLQWAPAGGGLCTDPGEKLQYLFKRFVMSNEEVQLLRSRTDEEVWSGFKQAFDAAHVTAHLQPKKIAVADDAVEFSHAYKNEVWHCIEPLSLDLALPESIKDKAHRWLGQTTSVRHSAESFRVYYLVGAPQSTELKESYRNALTILEKAPVAVQVVEEAHAVAFASKFRALIESHEQNPN